MEITAQKIVVGLLDANKHRTQQGQEIIEANVFRNGGDTLRCLIAGFINLLENLAWMVRLNIYYQRRFNVDWDELKKEAKKMGYHFMDDSSKEYLIETDIAFTRGGTIYIFLDEYKRYILKRRRTPDQMLTIMKALQ